jgi:putative transposase
MRCLNSVLILIVEPSVLHRKCWCRLRSDFSCCQDILRRVNKTFEAFFRRVKRGENAGYPRFKSRRRFASITFPSYGDGIQLNENRLRIQGIGQVEVKLHRPVDGKIKDGHSETRVR